MVEQRLSARAADGLALAVTVQGEGPPLLLIPGLGATRRVFDPIAQQLARRHAVIRYDPRGVGDSDALRGELTMGVLAADVWTVLDAAGAHTADVFGASMGGVVAQHVAVSDGERVRALLLAATSPGGSKAVPADPRVTAALMGRGARSPERAYRVACTVLYSAAFQRTHAEFIEAEVRRRGEHPVRGMAFTAQLRALERAPDITAELRRLALPALVMHGTADAVTPVENAETLTSLIPGARHRWFEGCGHLFFHERPDESARVIDEFARGAQASG